MRELSERISREGQPCIPTLGLERCSGTLRYVGTSKCVNLECDYIDVYSCNKCGRITYDGVDTEDGRVELIKPIQNAKPRN